MRIPPGSAALGGIATKLVFYEELDPLFAPTKIS
jgi:hypothetical protein